MSPASVPSRPGQATGRSSPASLPISYFVCLLTTTTEQSTGRSASMRLLMSSKNWRYSSSRRRSSRFMRSEQKPQNQGQAPSWLPAQNSSPPTSPPPLTLRNTAKKGFA